MNKRQVFVAIAIPVILGGCSATHDYASTEKTNVLEYYVFRISECNNAGFLIERTKLENCDSILQTVLTDGVWATIKRPQLRQIDSKNKTEIDISKLITSESSGSVYLEGTAQLSEGDVEQTRITLERCLDPFVVLLELRDGDSSCNAYFIASTSKLEPRRTIDSDSLCFVTEADVHRILSGVRILNTDVPIIACAIDNRDNSWIMPSSLSAISDVRMLMNRCFIIGADRN
jgi:hypothetical protein